MINDWLNLLPAFAAGLLLGSAFFGGLWWTVRVCVASPYPALWLLGSQLLRTGITLAGFYVVGRGDWIRLLTCLAGFIVARQIVVRLTRASAWPDNPVLEPGHATEPR